MASLIAWSISPGRARSGPGKQLLSNIEMFKENRSAAFECLHEDFKMFLQDGKITQAEMDEFEKDCFKPSPAASGAAQRRPAMSASPGPSRSRSAK
jgi:hypothetical protein